MSEQCVLPLAGLSICGNAPRTHLQVKPAITKVAGASGETVGESDDQDVSAPFPGTVRQKRGGNVAQPADIEVDGQSVDEVGLPAGGPPVNPQD